ncbi:hypothetical protein GGI12_004907, partial [Dipsacomyces acuminosporus]
MTYRHTSDHRGSALGALDNAVERKDSVAGTLSRMKKGDLPPTSDVVNIFHKVDFDKMREHATTYQGRKVVDNLRRSTNASIDMIESLNGEDNVQEIVRSLNNARKKTAGDRKQVGEQVKKGSKAARKGISSVGRDLATIIKGISTSAAVRKSITDIASLISATIREKTPKPKDATCDLEDTRKEAESIQKELERSEGKMSAAAYDAIQPLAAKVRAGKMTTAEAASAIVESSQDKLAALIAEGRQALNRDNLKRLVERLREIVSEVHRDPSIQKALRSISSLYTSAYEQGVRVANSVTSKGREHPATGDVANAKKHAKDIFTRMGNGYALAAMFAALSALHMEYKDNSDLRYLLDEVREFGSWTMEVDADELMSDEFYSRGSYIVTRGKQVLGEKSSEHFDVISKETRGYMDAVQHNPVLVSYKDAMVALAHSIVGRNMDSEDKSEHLKALRDDLLANLPLVVSTIRYIPIPRVSGQNEDLEFAADNLVLDLKRFVPEHIGMDYHTEIYPRSVLLKNKHAMLSRKGFHGEQFFYITITGVNCVAKGVAFYVKKKKGIPKIAEKGVADLIIGGKGMDIVISARKLHDSEKPLVAIGKSGATKSPKDKNEDRGKGRVEGPKQRMRSERHLDIVGVSAKLHDLDIKVHHNKHNVLSALAIPVIIPAAKKLIAKGIARSISSSLDQADTTISKYAQLTSVLVSRA